MREPFLLLMVISDFANTKKNIDKLERTPNKSVPQNFDLSNIVQMSIGEFKGQL